ncbi:MAG: hypothetical protein JXX29_20145 [Deltaproteobacteria bacterium]|nr:hypothetical protein [Deltaproteobacteria bacterium]MBN2674004.1 hypothetical protein [Deltaproteobacteria bacterium]
MGTRNRLMEYFRDIRGLLLFGLLLLSGIGGCYENQQVAQCEDNDECLSGLCVNGKCVDSDNQSSDNDSENDSESETITTYSEPMTGVDILFVVDSAPSMLHEQNKMGSAVRTLLLELTERLIGGLSLDLASIDARFAVITPDIGTYVGYDTVMIFPDPVLGDNCGGDYLGDLALMRTEISDDYNWDPEYPCPDISPFIEDDLFLALNDNNLYQEFRDAMTCMMPTGLHGCSIRQPLSAVDNAFAYSDQSQFLRSEALTVIIVVSDAEECSIKNDDWFNVVSNSGGVPEACVASNDSLHSATQLYELILSAKTETTGVEAEGSVMFAAIVGVPNTPDCQGRGDTLDNCENVELPGGGTMGEPFVGGDTAPPTVAYACEEWSGDGEALVQAYPGMRYVQIAREFGKLGYITSVCSESWNFAMSEIADIIAACMDK